MSGGLQYFPYAGQILMCRFDGNLVPEMTKTRPVIVITPRPIAQKKGTVSVIPLSTTSPQRIMPYHVPVALPRPVPEGFDASCWAKCDMIYTAGLARLSLIRMGKAPGGRRIYYQKTIVIQYLNEVRKGIAHALGITLIP